MISDTDRLLFKVFYEYYVRNLTQNEIAARHLISRKKVQRLLDKGREENLVEIKIRFPARMHGELESALEDKYDLLEAIVSDANDVEPDNQAIMIRNASDMAADYFLRVLSDNMTVSITWSNHVAHMLEEASRKMDSIREKPKNVKFALTLGAFIGSDPDIQTLEATRRISSALNGELHVMMAPSMTTTPNIQRAFLCEPQIAETMKLARHAGAAFFGIGSMEGESRQLPVIQRVMPETAGILDRLGAVGDINGFFFDANGEPVSSELDRRIVGLTINDIRSMPLTVGIATGALKYKAIKAVLTGRILKVLVTDVENARRLVAD